MTSATREPETPAAALPIRLIATDLDGTLLRDDQSVSPRTVAALAAAEAAGVEVFFVTGRPARWMDVVSEHVHGHGLAICGNGAAVVDLHGGPGTHRFVKVRELARDNALEAVRRLRDAAPGTVYAVEQTYGFHQEPEYPKLHMEVPDNLAPAEELLAPGGPSDGEPVLKILAYHHTIDPDAFLATARIAIGDVCQRHPPSPSALLEISVPRCLQGEHAGPFLCRAGHRGRGGRCFRGHAERHRDAHLGGPRRTPWATHIPPSSRQPRGGPRPTTRTGWPW